MVPHNSLATNILQNIFFVVVVFNRRKKLIQLGLECWILFFGWTIPLISGVRFPHHPHIIRTVMKFIVFYYHVLRYIYARLKLRYIAYTRSCKMINCQLFWEYTMHTTGISLHWMTCVRCLLLLLFFLELLFVVVVVSSHKMTRISDTWHSYR